jgi:twitching motility protein PilT
MAQIDELLQIVKSVEATDLHLVSGSVPMVRIGGELEKTRHRILTDQDIRQLVYELLSDEQIRTYEHTHDFDFSYGIDGVARFRINIYQTQSGMAAAVRLIPELTHDLSALGFSSAVERLADSRSGLILVTGPTNSGKTTTLAALVEHINTGSSRHIITLEDPIEYVHTNKNSLISQRQIGLHAESFATALRSALREDPNVIVVGEMRDLETISLALTAAETGLLVMGTLHTCTAAATIDRVVDVFPADQQQQIRIMLANSLRGIVAQQLVRRANSHGRIVVYELLLRSSSVAALIREGKTHQITNAIATAGSHGMKLFDNHLRALVDSGQVSPEEAVRVAVEPSQFYAAVQDIASEEIKA